MTYLIAFFRFVFSSMFYSVGAVSHSVPPHTENEDQLMWFGIGGIVAFAVSFSVCLSFLDKKTDYSYRVEIFLAILFSFLVSLLYFFVMYLLFEI